MRVAGVHDHAAPGVIDEQKSRIRLGVVLDTELDEDPVRDRHPLDEELDDPVLPELGEDAELRLLDLVGAELPDPAALERTDLRLEVAEGVRKPHCPPGQLRRPPHACHEAPSCLAGSAAARQ